MSRALTQVPRGVNHERVGRRRSRAASNGLAGLRVVWAVVGSDANERRATASEKALPSMRHQAVGEYPCSALQHPPKRAQTFQMAMSEIPIRENRAQIPCNEATREQVRSLKQGGETYDGLLRCMAQQYDPDPISNKEGGDGGD